MIGPGKYDEWATKVREATNAQGVIVWVIKGNEGTGFSVQASLEMLFRLPAILRDVANEIEADLKKGEL